MCELLRSFINKEIAIKNIRNEDELKRLDELIKEQTKVVYGIYHSLKQVVNIAYYTYEDKAAIVFNPKIHSFLIVSTDNNNYPYVPLDEFLDAVENTNIPTTNPEEWMCLLNA